jgi:hypothetical protein
MLLLRVCHFRTAGSSMDILLTSTLPDKLVLSQFSSCVEQFPVHVMVDVMQLEPPAAGAEEVCRQLPGVLEVRRRL